MNIFDRQTSIRSLTQDFYRARELVRNVISSRAVNSLRKVFQIIGDEIKSVVYAGVYFAEEELVFPQVLHTETNIIPYENSATSILSRIPGQIPLFPRQ